MNIQDQHEQDAPACAGRGDREAFERLRMYFRLNFTDGQSDGAFLKWCSDMCKQSARESFAKRRAKGGD